MNSSKFLFMTNINLVKVHFLIIVLRIFMNVNFYKYFNLREADLYTFVKYISANILQIICEKLRVCF